MTTEQIDAVLADVLARQTYSTPTRHALARAHAHTVSGTVAAALRAVIAAPGPGLRGQAYRGLVGAVWEAVAPSHRGRARAIARELCDAIPD